MSRRRRTITRTRAALLAIALVGAACSGGDIDVAPAPATTSSAGTTQPTATPAPNEPTTAPTNQTVDADGLIPAFPEPAIDDTPIEPDAAVRIGTLDNGLTYYVRSNDSPGNAVELRLAVNAGSLQQNDGDEGSAHFLEHMMFNGTEDYPGNSLDDVLRGFGMEFGADLNAYTSFDETVYILSLPSTASTTVNEGFNVLDQWASGATLDSGEVVAERGVVLEEYRLSENDPFSAVNDLFDEAYFSNSRYGEALPIGTDEQILATEPDRLLEFYENWYRPDLMAVVAVGDLPVGELESRVIDTFGDLTDRGATPDRPNEDVALIDEPFGRVLIAPEQATKFISLDITLPAWDASTVGGERLLVIEDLIAAMIQNRLAESASSGRSDLLTPSVRAVPINRNQRIWGFNTDAPDLGAGIEFILTDLHRLRVTGFDEAELARVVGSFQAGLASTASGQSSTQDFQYADLYVSAFLEGNDISSIDARVDRVGALLDGLSAQDINDHYRWVMANSAPIVILIGTGDDQGIPTDAGLLELMARAEQTGLTTASDAAGEVTEIDALLPAPSPVAPASTGTIDEPFASYWTFDNGATVVFKESDISAGAVDVEARSSGGWSVLDPGDAKLVGIATEAVAASGLGDISKVTLDRFLSDSTAFITPFIDETNEGFFGGADVSDVEEVFQLLHLLITAPRVDDPGFRQAVSSAQDGIRFAETDPFTILVNGLFAARYGDDPYQQFTVTQDELDALDPDQLLDLYRARLGKVDDLVIAVTGDLDASVVEELARAYVGTLPDGAADSFVDVNPPPPDDIITTELTGGNVDGAAGVVYMFELDLDITVRSRIAAAVLESIVNERLLTDVREDLGATYGGSASLFTQFEPDEGVTAFVVVEGDPERIDLIRSTVVDILEAVAADGVEAAEFDRATAVIGNDYEFFSNGDHLANMLDFFAHPDEELFTIPARQQGIQSVTVAEVDALAAQLFDDSYVEAVRTAG